MKINRRNITRILRILMIFAVLLVGSLQAQQLHRQSDPSVLSQQAPVNSSPAAVALTKLPVKGRAPKTGYSRALFSDGWGVIGSCDVRNYILARDMTSTTLVQGTCKVETGTLADPYTGHTVAFVRGPSTSDDVQIDHVVAISDAWQKGAQTLDPASRYAFANDPLNLLAVDGNANQQKADGDAATWLPPNKTFRCPYVARQIAVKTKYDLWVAPAEYDAMASILRDCPDQTLPK